MSMDPVSVKNVSIIALGSFLWDEVKKWPHRHVYFRCLSCVRGVAQALVTSHSYGAEIDSIFQNNLYSVKRNLRRHTHRIVSFNSTSEL